MKLTTTFFAACLLFASCSDISLLDVDMNFATATMTISATDNPDTTFSITSPFINPKDELEKNSVDIDKIKDASVKSVEVELISPETGNFDWAKNASVTVTAAGQPEVVIGEITDVPMGITSIIVNTNNADLKSYIQGGEFAFSFRGTNDQIIPVDHLVKVKATFTVGL